MKVFFDANVILDWILNREPTFEDSYGALRETIEQEYTAVISASSINDIHYVIRKALKDEAKARLKTELLRSLFAIAKVDDSVIREAFKLKGHDFEDDIVAATAIGFGADCIVTNNVKDYVEYEPIIAVYAPKDYLSYLRSLETL